MKFTKSIATSALVVFAAGLPLLGQAQHAPAQGQAHAPAHGQAHGQAAGPAQGAGATADAPMAEGEVRKVDRDGGRVTIRHGELKQLDMPPMTMVFHVRDKALLDGIQQGDKVRFDVVDERGKLFVTQIQAIR
jgi:Cu(I)/Ag(I) efflux system periplasmic protein CusF